MIRNSPATDFVRCLAEATPPEPYRNPYIDPIASENLGHFLAKKRDRGSSILLVGEAPGYRGALCSGVPLTSLSVLHENWDDPWQAFGPTTAYKKPDNGSYFRESTATMVWSALSNIFGDRSLPLTWNAVPFHRPDIQSPHSNSSIPMRDIELGREWLEWLIYLYPTVVPVAVGKVADRALKYLGVSHYSVRHPSRGGKEEFIAGLVNIRTKVLPL